MLAGRPAGWTSVKDRAFSGVAPGLGCPFLKHFLLSFGSSSDLAVKTIFNLPLAPIAQALA